MRLWLCLSLMNKICYIFGAGSCQNAVVTDDSLIIAADGGYEYLKKAGIKPDIIMGDFDSLGYIPKENNVTVLPAVKDDTDMAKAVQYGLSQKADTFVIYGGMGGRFDHTFANIQLLTLIAQKGKKAFLLGEGTVITAVCNGEIYFDKEYNGYISVFSHSEKSTGVFISGLKYELDNAEINNTVALGVSNEFTGKNAKIRVENGVLIIMWQQKTDKFIKKLISDEQL